MPVPVALNANDDLTLERLAADASLAVPAPGSVARRIEALAVTAGVSFAVVANDRREIERLAALLGGGGVCYQLTPGGVTVDGEILPANVAGMAVSVDAQIIAPGERYGASTEKRIIDWPAGEFRRLEIQSAESFDYSLMPDVQNPLRNMRGKGGLFLFGEDGQGAATLVELIYYRAYIGSVDETGGWVIVGQSSQESGNIGAQITEVEAARIALAVSGDGSLRVYIDGDVMQTYPGVFGSGWEMQQFQYIALPMTTGETEAQAVSASLSVNVGAGIEQYSDGSLGWCE